MIQRSKLRKHRKKIIILAVAIVLVAAASVAFVLYRRSKQEAATKQITTAGNPVVETTPDTSDKAAGDDPEKSPSITNSASNQSGATDTNGQAQPNSNDPSQWIVAKSGNITVKQPLTNATLKPGGSLIGSAKVGEVYYRLIDNKVGVVAQGTLSVNSGNFSGNLQFQTSATDGRLDVYSLGIDGSEINEIQIAVKL